MPDSTPEDRTRLETGRGVGRRGLTRRVALGAAGASAVGALGAAGLAVPGQLSAPTSVKYAARILGVEGYHAGAIRASLSAMKQGAATDAISAVRPQLSGVRDFGTDAQGNAYNITDVNSVGLAFTRTAGQVLSIVYGGGTNSGLFFPDGVNGAITTAAPPSSTMDAQEPS